MQKKYLWALLFLLLFSLLTMLLVSCGNTEKGNETESQTMTETEPGGNVQTETHTETESAGQETAAIDETETTKPAETQETTSAETGEKASETGEAETVRDSDLLGPIILLADGFTVGSNDECATLSMTVDETVKHIDLTGRFIVVSGCTWELYADFEGLQLYPLKSLSLSYGLNTAYVIVWNEEKTKFTRYELDITRKQTFAYTFISDGEVMYSGRNDSDAYLFAPYSPALTGMHFAYWTVNGKEVTLPVKLTEDTEFVAVFEPNEYVIELDANGGSVSTSSVKVLYQGSYELPTPTLKDYNFLGWYVGGTQWTDGIYTRAQNVTLTAKWEAIKTAGDGISWSYDNSTATLTLVGSGAMKDFTNPSDRPWDDFAGEMQVLNISDGITSVGASAFANCKALQKVILADTVTKIGASAFLNDSALTEVSGDTGLQLIASRAFSHCSSLAAFSFADTLTSVGESAFEGTGLTSVNTNQVISMGMMVFADCQNLKEAVLSDSLQAIPEKLFSGCTALEKLTVGSSVGYIGSGAFSGCTSLCEVSWKAVQCQDLTMNAKAFANAGNAEAGGFTFSVDSAVLRIPAYLFYCGSAQIRTLEFEDGSQCMEIGQYAFANCKSLQSIEIPQTVTTLGDKAFYNCVSLSAVDFCAAALADFKTASLPFAYADSTDQTFTVTVGSQVTRIPEYMFYGSKIASVQFAEGSTCQSIGQMAFASCKALTEMNLPASLVTVDANAFANCPNLTPTYAGTKVQMDSVWQGDIPESMKISCTDGEWPSKEE